MQEGSSGGGVRVGIGDVGVAGMGSSHHRAALTEIAGVSRSRNNRGLCRTVEVHRDVVSDWHFKGELSNNFEQESTFMGSCIDPRTREYASAVVERFYNETEAVNIPKDTASLPALFLQPVETKCIEWMKNSIKLRKTNRALITVSLFYRVLAILFYSHTCILSLSNPVDTLRRLGRSPPTLAYVRFVLTHLLSLPATKTRESSEAVMTWHAQGNYTKYLSEMETSSFGKVAQAFFVPACQTVTLDDNLVGTRARDV